MNPRPLFCVSEQVVIKSSFYPELNGRAEVVSIEGFRGGRAADGGVVPDQWHYVLSKSGPSGVWGEQAIRKLPPEDRITSEDFIANLNKIPEYT